jgi:murein L,D-transpeptidase YafK
MHQLPKLLSEFTAGGRPLRQHPRPFRRAQTVKESLLAFMNVMIKLLSGVLLLGLATLCAAKEPTVPESLRADSILIVKSERRLYLMRNHFPLHSYPVWLGLNPVGPKRYQGDFRTPEGRYLIDFRNARSKYTKSLHVSYPSAEDRKESSAWRTGPGGEIFIHGWPNVLSHPAQWYATHDWTNGCIALSNEDLQDVWDLTSDRIPVEIVP